LSESPARAQERREAGVLLVNLGTPQAPTRQAVREYLKEFLSDPRVVEIPAIVWQPILRLFVLTTRPKASAARYAQIWMPEGSPLRVYTERQANLLQGYLGERLGTHVAVEYAMRYGSPSIPEGMAALQAHGCTRILLLPLYPQYSGSTTATAFDAAWSALAHMRNQPDVRSVRDFHDDAGYIDALEARIRGYWTRHGRPAVFVMSFHGIPKRAVDRGDPYAQECAATALRLAAGLDLREGEYRVTYQSRFGRAEWLKPYTSEVLVQLAREKAPRVDVACPGFVSDCLETLEEIAIENKALFLNAGGREFHYISCLNDRHEWISALTDLAERNLRGWIERQPPSSRPLGIV
jgi:ferrochelatase